ncbi:hypothetical protein [Salinarimonas ramus]|uniref:Uncharacterized protein n=1 Tax=Salinarimonas ramus TaxID=690164 RepID=A0A917QGF8_9HYPH|nr:hypothetical protein [Salinarimonas ramus]GGK49452.1 hypothetical protein GCM10011322_40590 [Salinarimonas ramus]
MPERVDACPLASLCAEAERLIARKEVVERDGLASDSERVRRRMHKVVDEIDLTLGHIAGRASDHLPRSPEGALFALALAAGLAETIAVSDEPPPRADLRRLRRHLAGLRAYLEDGRAPMPAGVARYWMPAGADLRGEFA